MAINLQKLLASVLVTLFMSVGYSQARVKVGRRARVAATRQVAAHAVAQYGAQHRANAFITLVTANCVAQRTADNRANDNWRGRLAVTGTVRRSGYSLLNAALLGSFHLGLLIDRRGG